jgi:phospholipid/cholesterol/gamma-HCH transport system substrate-binding protein
MNPKPEYRALRIGLLMAAALVAAALFIVGITSRQKLFERKVEYYSYFPDAAGLKVGSGVWYQGVEVGFISEISFPRDTDNQNVKVVFRVSQDLVPRIRAGTRASLKSLGLLGDQFLALTSSANNYDQPIILPGNQIPIDKTLNLEALGRGAQDVINNTVQLSKNLNVLISAFNTGQGAIPRLLNDPEVGKTTIEQLQRIGASMDKIATTMAGGHGFAGKLLADPAYGDKAAADLADAIARTDAILKDVQAGKGGAGAFLKSGGEGERLVNNLSRTADALAKVADGLEKPNTFAHKVLMDEAYGEHLAANLLSMSDSMASILKKIDHGDGTVGALINDRSVYDSLAVVAESLRKNSLVNWYIKHKAEKTAEAAKRAEEGKPAS